MKYQLSVELKLQEIPDEPQLPNLDADNPIAAMGGALKLMTSGIARPAPFFMGSPAGFDFRKMVTVSVPHFAALADVIEQYVNLTEQIEFKSETHGSTATHPAP